MNPIEKKIDPFTIIIFGASGDLTKRKLIPALFHLFKKNKLSDDFIIIGFAHSTLTHASFRDQLKESLQRLEGDKWNADDWKKFKDRIYYQKGNFDKLNDYNKLNDFCSTFKNGNSNRLYYLATAPRFFKIITERLGSADMAKEKNGWRRLVIEKPFGHDLISAQVLNSSIHGVFQEHQIFRIDRFNCEYHYIII